MLIRAPKMMRKALQTVNEISYHTRYSLFSQLICFAKFFSSFWKKCWRLQLLLVDVMYPFLFCFCFWLSPFIAFNTELVYNVKTIMLLCHFYQGRIEMTVMGCACLLVASLSLVFWTINKLVRAADQDPLKIEGPNAFAPTLCVRFTWQSLGRFFATEM